LRSPATDAFPPSPVDWHSTNAGTDNRTFECPRVNGFYAEGYRKF
jgi:hypothetical protein